MKSSTLLVLTILSILCIVQFSSAWYAPRGFGGYRGLGFAPRAYGYNYGARLLSNAYGANYAASPYLYNPYATGYNPYSYYRPAVYGYGAGYGYGGYRGYGGYGGYRGVGAYRGGVGAYRGGGRREAEIDDALDLDNEADFNEADFNEADFDSADMMPLQQEHQPTEPVQTLPIPVQTINENEDVNVGVKVEVVKGETLAQHLAHLEREAAEEFHKMQKKC